MNTEMTDVKLKDLKKAYKYVMMEDNKDKTVLPFDLDDEFSITINNGGASSEVCCTRFQYRNNEIALFLLAMIHRNHNGRVIVHDWYTGILFQSFQIVVYNEMVQQFFDLLTSCGMTITGQRTIVYDNDWDIILKEVKNHAV